MTDISPPPTAMRVIRTPVRRGERLLALQSGGACSVARPRCYYQIAKPSIWRPHSEL